MNIDQQLAALHSALDDVLDLERGLADAMLPQAHTDVAADLDDVLDLDAGLTRILPPPPEEGAAQPTDGLSAFADMLAGLPAAKRLAIRTWMPAELLAAAGDLTVIALRAHAVADSLAHPGRFTYVKDAAVREMRRIIADFEPGDVRARNLHLGAIEFERTLTNATQQTGRLAGTAGALADRFCERLYTLLFHLREDTQDIAMIEPLAHRFHNAVSVHVALFSRSVPVLSALPDAIDQILAALTTMIGADLTSADLHDVPLAGVRWSPDTLWPRNWEDWVRGNSVEISADVFEIRQDSTGTNSRVPT